MSRQQLSYLARTGSLERVAQGVYRLRRFPAQRFEDVTVACLWAGDDGERSERAGIPVTTVERTITDVLERSGQDVAQQAAAQARDRGLVTRRLLRAALVEHGDPGRSLLDLADTSS